MVDLPDNTKLSTFINNYITITNEHNEDRMTDWMNATECPAFVKTIPNIWRDGSATVAQENILN